MDDDKMVGCGVVGTGICMVRGWWHVKCANGKGLKVVVVET